MADIEVRKLALSHFWVAFGAFGLAAVFGFYQVLERSELIPAIQSPGVYFASVSTHGVLMAYVLTTFFIMGFGYVTAVSSLKTPLWNPKWAWIGFWTSTVGTGLAAIPLLLGRASVLYTFYPPVQAHPLFYIGATLLVVGSWFWCVIMIVMHGQWKKAHPGEPVPLPMFATTANAILWLWTSAGVAAEVLFQLVPWALGLKQTVDVGLARTLFAWTLHPIVYFWLIPAYIALYSFVPKAAGGKLFSHELGRIAFVMLLVMSLPIGFHHLYMDPEQGAGFKLAHGVLTFLVAVPTLLTAFTVTASVEMGGRAKGGTGLFGWIGTLPWRNPMMLAGILAASMLVLGGFGGLVNASYALNAMVHNTAWVAGHFHLIFGGTTIIMYMAIAYYLWPSVTGKPLYSSKMVLVQLWSWFWGFVILTTAWHILGLLGQPRRISTVTYNSPLTFAWDPYVLTMVVGGTVLTASAALFVYILAKSHRQKETGPVQAYEIEYVEDLEPVTRVHPLLNGFSVWNIVIAALMLANFGYPIAQFFLIKTFGSVAWGY
ncbi:b(o/a)3-type cytochrome-c oxidase subunit 1 [Methylocaldum sp.]|uniref:b(o/a)3-type cytochrome-c oxidase subunit 1 n=1 Tax=Methylocaldum sp. TaxID=1969727 RepID=UPI002D494EBF|nr:b(o/a)3-type cytochrome-c oxidase subunit 1 [Methylocaldum sp.]HYE36672.1 b(o/a)3-type cytochrome-c oxidase subunit 1 [Methylocaldum sp.]